MNKATIRALTLEEKRKEINRILDEAEKDLQAMDCKYMVAAICRDKRDEDGGKVIVNLGADGADMEQIIRHAFPHNRDLIRLGVWVGNEIMRRNRDANITLKSKPKTRKPKAK